MDRRLPRWGIVFGFAVLTFFLRLGTPLLFDEDEPKNAVCGREMFVRGDWIVPTFNEELRTDKPILVYWFMLTSFHVFGVTEFAARFWSAALAVGTCLLTYNIGRLLFSREAGMWAGLALASTLMFTTVARASTPDSTLIFFTTLSLFLFVRFGNLAPRSDESEQLDDWRSFLPKSAWAFLAIYAVMSVAVLAKGPVGVLLPCVVIGFFLYASYVNSLPNAEATSRTAKLVGIARRWIQPGAFFRISWAMRPYWILLCLAVIALPWYIAVGIQTEGAWLKGFLGQHNVSRFLKPMEGHSGPIFYYPVAMLIGFFPWSVLTLPVIRGIARQFKMKTQERPGLLFIVGWFTVYFVFFSCARTKLPNYVLPCYPALALMAGWWIARAAEEGVFNSVSRDFTWAAWSLILVGAVMSIGLGVAASVLLSGEELLGAVGLVPLIGGIAVWRMQKTQGFPAARKTFAGVAVAFIALVFTWAAPRISRHQDGQFLAEQLKSHQNPTDAAATYNYSLPSLVYYAERRIDRCRMPADVSDVLSSDNGLLITRADRMEELRPQLPEGTEILARRRRFLRQHDIVILGRPKTQPVRMANESGRDLR